MRKPRNINVPKTIKRMTKIIQDGEEIRKEVTLPSRIITNRAKKLAEEYGIERERLGEMDTYQPPTDRHYIQAILEYLDEKNTSPTR